MGCNCPQRFIHVHDNEVLDANTSLISLRQCRMKSYASSMMGEHCRLKNWMSSNIVMMPILVGNKSNVLKDGNIIINILDD